MSFLDKILDGDIDEKAVRDMQQNLQSEIYSSQQGSASAQVQPKSEPFMPQPPNIASMSSSNPVPPVPEPSFTRTKTEPGQTRPTSGAAPVPPPAPQSAVPSPAAPPQGPTQPTIMAVLPGQSAVRLIQPNTAGQQQILAPQTVVRPTSTIVQGLTTQPVSNIVPTAVITPQRVPQVIAVSSSVMQSVMSSGGHVFQSVPATSQPTLMVSTTPTTHVNRPNLISQSNIRQITTKPMMVPIQPLVQVKPPTGPVPIQPNIGPKTEQRTAAILSNMGKRESVQKLKAFLTNLLSISNKQDASTGQTVKDLIGKVMTSSIDEEAFLNQLQIALKSPPQPHLLVFLKQSVPELRSEMQSRQRMSVLNKPPQPSPQGDFGQSLSVSRGRQ